MFDGFYHTGFLWLSLGAVAPVIIHLMARSRPKPTPFPALRFILASHRRSSAKFKLKQLLLLLLRMLALAVFAFVMARPLSKGAATSVTRARATVTAVIVLDTSYSMGRVHADGQSSLDKAKDMAIAVIDAFTPSESRVCFLVTGGAPHIEITDFAHGHDLEGLKDSIRRAPLAYRKTLCAPKLKQAARMLTKVDGVGKSVFLFADLTRKSWPRAVAAEPGSEDITIYVADVGNDDTTNPGIRGVTAPQVVATDSPIEVRARVDAEGTPEQQQVELLIDGQRRRQQDAKTGDVDFQPTSVGGGQREHWGRVVLDVEDALTLDNTCHFSFRSGSRIRVLLVNGAPSASRDRDEPRFLQFVVDGPPPRFRRMDRRPAQLDSAGLGDADIAVLCNVGGLSRIAWGKIRAFVADGGGLMVFGGQNVLPRWYDATYTGDLLPCSIGAPLTPAERVRLEPGELKHPITRVFRRCDNVNLSSARFSAYLRLTPNPRALHSVVLSFKNGDAALVAGPYKAGKVLVFASTCDDDWNTLPGRPANPILMRQCLKFLAPSQAEQQRDVLVGGAPLLRISDPKSVESVTVARAIDGRPDAGTPLFEEEEPVTDRLDRRTGRLRLTAFTTPGAYRVEVKRGDMDEPAHMYFAVNLDTKESDLTRIGAEEEIRLRLPGYKAEVARDAAGLLDKISRSESIAEMSSHLAGIMLLILLGEMYLSNRMRARVEGEQSEE